MSQVEQTKHVGMTQAEIQEYLGGVVSNPGLALPSPLEDQAAGELRHAFAEKTRLEQLVVQHEQSAVAARASLQQQAGAIGALSTILYKAEGIRRLATAEADKMKKDLENKTNGVTESKSSGAEA